MTTKSREPRPVVLVDQDGPLAGFDDLVYARCGEEGWPMDCEPHTQTARYSTDHLTSRKHKRLARAMIEAAGWFGDLPLVEGARDGLEELACHADVWICTKPLEPNPTCRDDKAAWVRRHLGEEWERRLIIAPDKSMVRADILLDDAPFPEWLDRAVWLPVIYPCSWNGDGSPWEGLPRWRWGHPVDELLQWVGAF